MEIGILMSFYEINVGLLKYESYHPAINFNCTISKHHSILSYHVLEQITGKNEKEKLNVPRFPHLHILQSKNFKFPAFFDKIVKKGLSLLLVGIEPQSPG